MKTKIKTSWSFLCFSLLGLMASPVFAAPQINNNAGTWTDSYTDGIGISGQTNTVVNSVAGIVELQAGQTSGSFETIEIAPNSFSGWGVVFLDASFSAASDVQVEVLDPLNGNANLLGPVNADTPLDLSSLSASTFPELRIRVLLTEGAIRPSVSQLQVTWDPESALILNKTAAAEVTAGDVYTYRLNYSTAFVNAIDLVVWDTLADLVVPVDYGQTDNVNFVSATQGGQFTSSAITVKGVSIPANSVYWDLGTVDQGASEVLLFTVQTQRGTLDGSVQSNTAFAEAANAEQVSSPTVQTTIRSAPSPAVTKRGFRGVFLLPGGVSYTNPEFLNEFQVQLNNRGTETMFDTVLYDNLDDLTGKIDPNFGGTGIPVSSIAPPNGQYTSSAITVDGVSIPANSVYWPVGLLPAGAGFSGRFSVEMLDEITLTAASLFPGTYTNTAVVDSARTTPVSDSLVVNYPLDETPIGIFAKGDGISGNFASNAGRDDNRLQNDSQIPGPNNPFRYVRPGDTVPFVLTVRNSGFVALNDVVFLDRVPEGTTFTSAWFSDPWLEDNAKIYYSTNDTGDPATPHPYDVTQAPADFDPVGNTNWEDYDLNPPANPEDVRWVAFWIPAVNSENLDNTIPGWIPGAPTDAAGYFDVVVDDDFLDPTPCEDQFVSNLGLFRIEGFTPLAGGPQQTTSVAAQDEEPVRIAIDKPILAVSGTSSASPSILDEPGLVEYTTTIRNTGEALAENVILTLNWPQIEVNGVLQYLSFAGVDRPITAFNPMTGTVSVSLGNIVPGASASATLRTIVPSGVGFGETAAFQSTAVAEPVLCTVNTVSSSATITTRFLPSLRVFKNDVVDIVSSGDTIDYTLTARNVGNAPASNVWVIDRVPNNTVFVDASGPNGEEVWFSQTDNLPPAALTNLEPLDFNDIVNEFAPGTPSGTTWTSPFGDQTRWVAWKMDNSSLTPPIYPVGFLSSVGFTVQNDQDAQGPNTDGSADGTVIYNIAGIFSDELVQAIGNEVVTTIDGAPGILVEKTGPDVLAAGETFEWTISYINNSGEANDTTVVTDTLPAGVTFLSATHTWNAVSLTNGAPVNNNGLSVPTSVTSNPDGTTTLVFNIANSGGTDGYRGDNAQLQTQGGGTITLQVQASDGLASQSVLLNQVVGTATNIFGNTTSRDEHPVEIRNADVRVTKSAQTPQPVAGDIVTYNLIVSNDGLVRAETVRIQDTLPPELSYVPGSLQVLSPDYEFVSLSAFGQSIGFTLREIGVTPSSLPPSSGDIFIQYQAEVAAGTPSGTDLTNVVVVTTTTTDEDETNNEDDAEVSTPFPDPTVVKSGSTLVNPGERILYRLTYFNNTRQAAEGVYVIDTLPDYTGDGEADITFVSQTTDGPGAVTVYYNDASTAAVPAFDPADPTAAANGWSATPPAVVNHIAWLIGDLPGEAGPFQLTVNADAVRPNGGTPLLLPAAVLLENAVEIFLTGQDEDPNNNTDTHITRTPGNDVSLTKTGSSEGAFPGILPGADLTYTLEIANNGTQVTYGLEVVDDLPTELTPGSPAQNLTELTLVDENGLPAEPVDALGNAISGPIPVTVVETGNEIRWFFGSDNASDPLYFRNIGLLPGQRQLIEVNTTVNGNVANATRITNEATVFLRNQTDSDPAEVFTDNNTDDSDVIVYQPDLTLNKSVRDVPSDSESFTEAGSTLEYTLEYNNIGFGSAENVVIREIIPEGTTLLDISAPTGTNIITSTDINGRVNAFDLELGTLVAPANVTGVTSNQCVEASSIVLLTNGSGGIPDNTDVGNNGFMGRVEPVGDIDGDGVMDLVSGIPQSDIGAGQAGGAVVILMNTDGTAKDVVKLVDGQNGIPSSSFASSSFSLVGSDIVGMGDIDGDGVPDIALSNPRADLDGFDTGGAYVVLLNNDGTAKSVVQLGNGLGGIPNNTFENFETGKFLENIGDLDNNGVSDLMLSDYANDSGANNSGGVWVVLLDTSGQAISVVELANGKGGIPLGTFVTNATISSDTNNSTIEAMSGIGDVNGDNIPDIALANIGQDDVFILLMNSDGTVQSLSTFDPIPGGIIFGVGTEITSIGDLDSDGVPDIVSGIPDADGRYGGAVITFLNPDGTEKSSTILARNRNGINNTFIGGNSYTGESVTVAGDVDGDGVADLLLGSRSEEAILILLRPDGTAKRFIPLGNDYFIPSMPFNSDYASFTAAVGDLDGDGRAELLVTDPDYGSLNNGAAFVFNLEFLDCAESGNEGFSSLDSAPRITNGRLSQFREFGANDPGREVDLTNSGSSIPAGTFNAGDQVGNVVRNLGDVDGDGVPDVVFSAPGTDSNTGGAWIVLLNSDATAKSLVQLANGSGGIPAATFAGASRVGTDVESLGDLDLDGVPDVLLGASGIGGEGGAWVILLNPDGTAKTTVELADGVNGIPGGTLNSNDQAGQKVAVLGDINSDTIPDIVLGVRFQDDGGSNAGGALVLIMNADGTVASAVPLFDGQNGIPAGSFLAGDQVGSSLAPLGDIDGDGIPDLGLGAPLNDDDTSASGGGWIILLNSDGTAKSAVELANGLNGVPAGTTLENEELGFAISSAGDVDNDGVPDVVLSHKDKTYAAQTGGVVVFLLNSDGTVRETIEISAGKNGLSAYEIPNSILLGKSLRLVEDVDQNGVQDLLLGGTGGLLGYLFLLNPDGTLKDAVEYRQGVNGVPNFSNSSYDSLDSLGDLDGDGFPEFIFGASAGGARVLNTSPGSLFTSGELILYLTPNDGIQGWDRLFSDAEVPPGTTLTYEINGIGAGGAAPLLTIPGPLPLDGFDISSIGPNPVRLDITFTTTQPDFPDARTPDLDSVFATYRSTEGPSFSFRVQVDDPVAASVLPTIENIASISSSTPELDLTNNTAEDDINLRLTDMEVVKTTSNAAALVGDTVTFTLDWANNGPQDAVNAVLTDTLPAGLTYVSATPAPDSVVGQVLTWNLGDVPVATSGTFSVETTVDAGTTGQTLTNVTQVTNDRQDVDPDNNEDDAIVVINTLANVFITKDGPATASLGSQVTFTLSYGSNGNTAADEVVIADILPAGLTYASAVPAPDSVVGQTVTWGLGTLPPGTAGSIQVVADVGSDFLSLHNQTVVNNVAISTSTPEVTQQDNQDDHPVLLLGELSDLTGRVWVDRNANGVEDATESGLSNVVLTLSGQDVFGATVSLTTTTQPNGDYGFTNLVPGTYTVTQTQPAGFRSTVDQLGTVFNTLSGTPPGSVQGVNVDPLDNILADITLGSGDRGEEYNFGETLPVEIGDEVYVDISTSIPLSPITRLSIAGAQVSLFEADGVTPAVDFDNSPVPSQTTGSDGLYRFTNLRPNEEYVVRVLPPSTDLSPLPSGGDPDNNDPLDSNGEPVPGELYVQSQPATLILNNFTVDFGFTGPGSIGNFVWRDENSNGLQDAGEPGLPNTSVNLYDGSGELLLSSRTDANGGYGFTGLPAGTYYVDILDGTGGTNYEVGAFIGLTQTNTAGPANTDFVNQDHSSVPIPGTSLTGYPVTLGGANPIENTTADFGYNSNPTEDVIDGDGTGTIGDRVWLDADGDGFQDPGEVGLPFIFLQAFTDPDGDGTYDTSAGFASTDDRGNYQFDNLPPGSYVIEIPSFSLFGYSQTGDPDFFGTTGGVLDNRTTVPVVLAPGDVFLNADFGYQPDGGNFFAPSSNSVGDRIWLDANANGVQDTGEPGLSGVRVSLFRDSNNNQNLDLFEPVLSSMSTDDNGEYLFTGLPDGSYIVKVDGTSPALSGLAATFDADGLDTANLSALDIDPSGSTPTTVSNTDQDFGYAPAGHDGTSALLGDRIWRDINGNGLQDTGEPGLGGVLVELQDGGNSVIASQLTTANGTYAFGSLDAGTYTLVVTPPAGLSPTADADGLSAGSENRSSLTLAAGDVNLDQDFGYNGPGEIGNFIWEDVNANGVVDGSESGLGLPGVTLDLYRDADSSGTVTPGDPVVSSTITDSNGAYTFAGLSVDDGSGSATYLVNVTDTADVLNGYWHSLGAPGVNQNSQTDPVAVTLSSGSPLNETADFGYYVQPSSLGDFVWDDQNGNGLQDTGEPGLENVQVTLTITYPNTSVITLTSVTDASGAYSFGNLALGSLIGQHVVSVDTAQTALIGYTPTALGRGDGANDSDDPAGVLGTVVQGNSNTLLDFGFTRGSFGDTVWIDVDNTQDPDDYDLSGFGINGVTVRLNRVGSSPQTDFRPPVVTGPNPDGSGENGYYMFHDLPAGDYEAVVDTSTVPSGFSVPTTPLTIGGTIGAAETFDEADFGFRRGAGTAIELVSFTGSVIAEGIRIRWETAMELNTAGFRLHRADSNTPDEKQLLTPALIPGQGSENGHVYFYTDTTVSSGGSYHYWLEEVETDGDQAWYGPVAVQVDALENGNVLFQASLPGEAYPAGEGLFKLPASTLIGAGVPLGQIPTNRLQVWVNETEVPRFSSTDEDHLGADDFLLFYVTLGNESQEVQLKQSEADALNIDFLRVRPSRGYSSLLFAEAPEAGPVRLLVDISNALLQVTGLKESSLWMLDVTEADTPRLLFGQMVIEEEDGSSSVILSHPGEDPVILFIIEDSQVPKIFGPSNGSINQNSQKQESNHE